MKIKTIFLLTLLIFCQNLNLAWAAGAYLVDDGGVIDAKTFQVENWYNQSTTGEKIFVTNPAYQILPNTEFALQETYSEKSDNLNTLFPQLKYLWHKSSAKENFLSSVAIGVNYSTTEQKTYGYYAYIPTTFKPRNNIDLHLYVGLQNWRHASQNDKTIDFLNYGMGTEIHLNQKLSLTAEAFQGNGTKKSGSTKPALQAGSRYIATKNLILDLIYGKNINGNNQNWLTLGITVLF